MKNLKILFPFILIILALIAMLTRQQIGFFLFIGLLYIIFDLYTYHGLLSLSPSEERIYGWAVVYFLISAIGIYGFIYAFQHMRYDAVMRTPSANLLLGFSFTLFVGKLVFASLMSFQDVSRLLIGIGQYFMDIFSSQDNTSTAFIPSRRKALTMLSAGLAAIPFASMLYGITRGKYQFSITNNVLKFPDLPPEFDGFKIVQISDVHSGSWDDLAEVGRGVKMIQEQAADIIVFTGDLVNTHKDEINPFLDIFATLSAPYGKYASLGNHDYYGDRIVDKEERSSYWADFYKKYEQMGFDLLNNTNRYIYKGKEKISLVGVENWGAGRWFPKKGDLDKALEGTSDGDFTVLLSHDPTHWDEHVIKHKKPFKVLSNDYDNNGINDIVLVKNYHGKEVPVRGRECSSEQMPFIAEKFETYNGFANASIQDILGEEKIKEGVSLSVNTFESIVLINNGGQYEELPLPIQAQAFPIYGIEHMDLNNDGLQDLIVCGNIFNMEPETPRQDAGNGLTLINMGNGTFNPLGLSTGFYAPNDAKALVIVKKANGQKMLIVANNSDDVQCFDRIK